MLSLQVNHPKTTVTFAVRTNGCTVMIEVLRGMAMGLERRNLEVRDYTFHRLEIWRDKRGLSHDEALQKLLDAADAPALTDGYKQP